VVSVVHFYGHEPPVLTADDLTVTDHYDRLPITKLTPLHGGNAALQLFLLVDNCSNCEPGSKFEELRKFIASQPPSTAIGVAYIQDGRLEVAENPTQDRERVIQAINPPAGGKPSNPFRALAELVEGWKQDSCRHAVLLISNGINPAATSELQDLSVETAIEAAQRNGVAVFAIYHPSADYATSDSSRVYSGQTQLAHLAYETGGEAYFLGYGPLPSLAPFLSDMESHFANQYLLEFVAGGVEGSGTLQQVTVRSKIPDLEILAPARVWVAGSERKSTAAPAKLR